MKGKKICVLVSAVVLLCMMCSAALALNSGSAGLRDNTYYGGAREQAREYTFVFNQYEELLKGQHTWKVFTAPSMDAYRAANGKASVHMEDDVYSAGWSGAWLLIRYPKVSGGFRIGWVPKTEIGTRRILQEGKLNFAYWPVTMAEDCALTDDPLYESDVLAYASAGEELTYLACYQYKNGREYAYVRGELENGQPVCGFVPFDAIAW